MATQPSAVASQPAPASPVKDLIDVFVNPGALFGRLAAMPKWAWIVPALVGIVVAVVVAGEVEYPVDYEALELLVRPQDQQVDPRVATWRQP